MDLDLSGRHALVCGASEGIGRATAYELALLGATVTVLARRQDALEAVVSALPCSNGQRHRALVADVSQRDALRAKVEALAADAPVGRPASEAIKVEAEAGAHLAELRRALEDRHAQARRQCVEEGQVGLGGITVSQVHARVLGLQARRVTAS